MFMWKLKDGLAGLAGFFYFSLILWLGTHFLGFLLLFQWQMGNLFTHQNCHGMLLAKTELRHKELWFEFRLCYKDNPRLKQGNKFLLSSQFSDQMGKS